MSNGVYNYYAPDATQPLVCVVENGWVWSMDSERTTHYTKLAGRFVRLVEETEPQPAAIEDEVSE